MSALRPDSNKGHDLGSSSVKWGTAHLGDLKSETGTFSSNLTVEGNLTVTGTQTSLQVSTVEAEDPLIKLARGNSGDTLDIGFYGQSNDGSDKYHGLYRDQSDGGKFKLFKDLASEPSTTVGTLASGNKATLVSHLEGDVTGDLTGKADTADALETARAIALGGDLGGTVNFDGSADVSITATIQSDAVENSMIANPGYTFGDGTTPALRELGTAIVIQGTSNEVEVARVDGTFTVGLPSTVSGLTSVSSTGFTGALTGNASTASALETARAIQISGDVAGTANFDGSNAINIAATIQGGAVENSMLDNSTIGITIDGTGGESIALGETIDFNGTANQVAIAYSAGGNDLTFSLPSTINVATTGNAATATAQETARNFSVSSTEMEASAISYDGTANVALDIALKNGSVANGRLANSSITFSDGSNTSPVSLGGTLTIQGTSNEVEVAENAGTYTIGLPSTISSATSGNAATATALATARNFEINAGPVRAGAVSFDGTGNANFTSTIAADQITNAMLENDKLVIQVDGVDYDRALGTTLEFDATNLDLSYSASEDKVIYGLPASIGSDTSGNAATATALETARNIGITAGPVRAANISFDATGNVGLTSTIAADEITNTMLANPGFGFGDGGTPATSELGKNVVIQGTSNEVDCSVSHSATGPVFTIGLPNTIQNDTSGNAATATALETARNFSIGSGPVQAGAVSFDGTGNLSLSTTIGDDQITNDMLVNPGFTVSDTSNSETLELGSTLFIGGTSSEVEVAYSAALNKFTVGLPASVNVTTNLDVGAGLSVGGNAVITGNISAAGLSATGANVSFADNLLELGVSNTDLEDIGFYGQRGDGIGGSNGFAGVAFDESADEFIAFTSSGEPTTTVGTHSAADFKVAKMTTSEVDCSGAVAGQIRLEGSEPASASASGTAGDIRFDSGFIYVCVSTNTWKRVAIGSF